MSRGMPLWAPTWHGGVKRSSMGALLVCVGLPVYLSIYPATRTRSMCRSSRRLAWDRKAMVAWPRSVEMVRRRRRRGATSSATAMRSMTSCSGGLGGH